jgi:hypothetical protein
MAVGMHVLLLLVIAAYGASLACRALHNRQAHLITT